MHLSILAIGTIYDVIFSKSDSAICKGSNFKAIYSHLKAAITFSYGAQICPPLAQLIGNVSALRTQQ